MEHGDQIGLHAKMDIYGLFSGVYEGSVGLSTYIQPYFPPRKQEIKLKKNPKLRDMCTCMYVSVYATAQFNSTCILYCLKTAFKFLRCLAKSRQASLHEVVVIFSIVLSDFLLLESPPTHQILGL